MWCNGSTLVLGTRGEVRILHFLWYGFAHTSILLSYVCTGLILRLVQRGPIVQLVERQTVNLYVLGSSPSGTVNFVLLAQLEEHLTFNQVVLGSIPR